MRRGIVSRPAKGNQVWVLKQGRRGALPRRPENGEGPQRPALILPPRRRPGKGGRGLEHACSPGTGQTKPRAEAPTPARARSLPRGASRRPAFRKRSFLYGGFPGSGPVVDLAWALRPGPQTHPGFARKTAEGRDRGAELGSALRENRRAGQEGR